MVANEDDGPIERGRKVRRGRVTQAMVETHDISQWAQWGRIDWLGNCQLPDLFSRVRAATT